MFIFPVQLTTSRIGNLTRLIHTLLYVMTIHTYIHTYILPNVRRYKTSSPQGSSSNGCYLFRYQNGPSHQRIYFSAPARGELNRKQFFLFLFAPRKFGLVRQFRPSRPAPAHPSSKYRAEPGAYSWDFSCIPRRRPSIPSTAIGSVPSWSGHAITYRWRSLSTVRRHRASSPQDSSRGGCCLFRYHHGALFSFPTPTIGMY